MTKLLKQAMERLSQLPPAAQDTAARALIQQLEEEPEFSDLEAIEEGRKAFGRGEFVTLKEWRHEMGLGDH
jgi:predicted transcriptional regulator